ncbi:MAG: hypothetical protein NC102_09030 [Clostridium sp.]|nr:hypothetical protein [Clostridium sp.]
MVKIEHRRVLARRLMHEGREYSTAIVEISADRQRIEIGSFERETAGTTYVSRRLRTVQDGGWWLAFED